MPLNKHLLVFLLFAQILHFHTYKILILQPFGSISHRQAVVPIAVALGSKGHHVTFVSTYNFNPPLPVNVTEIVYPQFKPHFKILQDIVVDTVKNGWYPSIFRRYYKFHAELCRKFFQSNLLQNWIFSNQKFDVVMIDTAINECILPLWHYLGKSLILLNTGLLNPSVVSMMNIPTSYAHIPLPILPYTHRMNFFQRIVNTIYWLSGNYVTSLGQKAFYEHVILPYFPYALTYDQSMRNISLVLVNNDPVLSPPRPYLPTVIPIGGIQCTPPNPLSQGELKSFVDGSDENGFILFSFGSVINGELINEDVIKVFVRTFAKISQRVVWKYESKLENLSDNVMITKWFPQQDLLGHPKIRLFISHGGLQSLQEGIYHAVPQICFPMTTDQPYLVATAVSHGIALTLDPFKFTEDDLYNAIEKATTDENMHNNVLYYSRVFRDRDETPLEKAVYWTEYVMKFQGAPHLRSASENLNFFQYYLLDVLFVMVLVVLFITTACWLEAKRLIIKLYEKLMEYLKCLSFNFKTI